MELPFVDNKGNNVSSDFRFASAVAMFGQLLRESDFKGNASYDKVIDLAKQGLNNDDKGYRREFIRLVEAAKGLERTNKNQESKQESLEMYIILLCVIFTDMNKRTIPDR